MNTVLRQKNRPNESGRCALEISTFPSRGISKQISSQGMTVTAENKTRLLSRIEWRRRDVLVGYDLILYTDISKIENWFRAWFFSMEILHTIRFVQHFLGGDMWNIGEEPFSPLNVPHTPLWSCSHFAPGYCAVGGNRRSCILRERGDPYASLLTWDSAIKKATLIIGVLAGYSSRGSPLLSTKQKILLAKGLPF